MLRLEEDICCSIIISSTIIEFKYYVLFFEGSSLTPVLSIRVILGYMPTLDTSPVLIFVSSPRFTLIQSHLPCCHFLYNFLLFCSPGFPKICLSSRLPIFRCQSFLRSSISPDPLWLVGGDMSMNEGPALPLLKSWDCKRNGPSLESWIAWILIYSKEVMEFNKNMLNSRLFQALVRASVYFGEDGGQETQLVVRPCPKRWSRYKASN